MPTFPGRIESRLPRVGTTIFTVMSRLAAECGALNLSPVSYTHLTLPTSDLV